MLKKYSKKLKEIVNYLINNYKTIRWSNKIVKDNKELFKNETSWMPKNSLLKEKIFCIQNDIFSRPKCLLCGKEISFILTMILGYRKYCSNKCANNYHNENRSQNEKDIRKRKLQKKWENKTQKEINEITKKRNITNNNKSQKEKDEIVIKRLKSKNDKSQKEKDETKRKRLKTFNNKSQKEKDDIYKRVILSKIENGTLYNVGGFSKISQKLFWKIYNQLPKELQEKTYFGENKENGGEFGKKDKIRGYKYDFVISNIKICIEYNGEKFHPNPTMTEEEWNSWSPLYSEKTADEIYVENQYKLNILRNEGFLVLEVWHFDFLKNQNEVIQKCLQFIRGY